MRVIHYIGINSAIRSVGILSVLLFSVLSGLTFLPLSFHTDTTEAAPGTATESTITLDVTNNTASVDLTVNSTNGTFATSTTNNEASFSVTTNNYTGYTLSISAADDTGTLDNGEYNLSSIASNLTESEFNTTTNNGKWGYKPSKYYVSNEVVDNTGEGSVFLSSPTTNATTLDVTSTANNEANSYTIGLGARADYSSSAGTYTKTFILTAVGNPINYSVTYNANAGADTVTNMPYSNTSNTQSGDTSSTSITLSNLVPVRDGYDFKGWCSVATSDHTCPGTTYNPNGDGTNLAYGIDKTTVNNASLYAMWKDAIYMQSMNWQNCVGEQKEITDNRDGNVYTASILSDGACWMTQNLRLGADGNQVVLTSDDSDVTNDFVFTTSSTWSGTFTSSNVDTARAYYSGDEGLGSYYNWYTATAGTGNSSTAADAEASGSICPKGWVLPNRAEYAMLLGQYGNDENKLWSPALPNYVITGYYNNTSYNQSTTHTYAWERTAKSASSGDNMFLRLGEAAATDGMSKYYGMPVRCRLSGEKTSFTVTYNANGGTGTMGSQTTNTGSITLNANSFTRQGYLFAGWDIDPDAIKPTIKDGATIMSYVDNLTLYAVWQKAYSITFTKDGNVPSIEVTDTEGNTVGTITSSGSTLVLKQSVAYTLKPSFAPGYTLNDITLTSGFGTLSGKLFTVGAGEATINITSKVMLQMQNYNCSNLTNIGDTEEVYDVRDNEVYLIGKLADNRCWLLDNLRLDIVANKNNITSSNTNASDIALSYLKGVSTGTTSDKYATAGVSYWTSSYSYSTPLIARKNASNENWNPNTVASITYGEGSGKIGIYYNFCAASAGTYCWGNGRDYDGSPSSDANTRSLYDIDGDICPTGWKIPTNSSYGEYQTLYAAYNSNDYDFKTALSIPVSGSFLNGSAYSQGTSVLLWSSTWFSYHAMDNVYASSSSVHTSMSGSRYAGEPVRCISMPTITYSLNYDQNTTDIVSNMPTSPTPSTIQSDYGTTFTLPTDKIPTRSGYIFAGWGISADQAIPTYKYENGTFTPSSATVYADDNPETLYAIWQVPRTITFTKDGNVSSIEVADPEGNTVGTITSSGATLTLMQPVTYTIKPTFVSGYTTNTIALSSGYGTLNGKNFTVGDGSANINITSKVMLQMQNYNCSNLANIGDTEEVYDTRDNEVYLIGKLKDGKCWMLENLNLAGGTALSANDTDVISNYISYFSTSNNLTKSGSTIILPASSTSGFDTNNYSYVYNSGNKTNCGAGAQNSPCYSYYSWDVATLGSGRSISASNTDASQSICPKGWKLPRIRTTSGTNWQTTSDFYTLAHQYGLDGATTFEQDGDFYNQAGPGTLPNFLLSGYYTGSLSFGGDSGFFWSATVYSSSKAEHLSFSWNSVGAANDANRYYGYSVRCLIR